jgi:hypothetical protein
MARGAPLPHRFTLATWPSAGHTLRWPGRPRPGPRGPRLLVGPWGISQAQPGPCNAAAGKSRAARAPAMTSPAHAGMAASARGCPGCWPLGSGACRGPRTALPQRWGGLGGRAIAGVGAAHCRPVLRAGAAVGGSRGSGGALAPRGPAGASDPGRDTTAGAPTAGAPGRGHDDKDRPALIAWVRRPPPSGIPAPPDGTVQTGQQAADRAVHTGQRLSTDSASSSRARTDSRHDQGKQTRKAEARGAGHAPRAEGLWSCLPPSLWGLRGLSTTPRPGKGGFLPCVRTGHHLTAGAQAERRG